MKSIIEMYNKEKKDDNKQAIIKDCLELIASRIGESYSFEETANKQQLRLEKAEHIFKDQEKQIQEAEPKARKKISKELIIVRDKLFIIEDTIQNALKNKNEKNIPISDVELNNILDTVSIIKDELKSHSLWDNDNRIEPVNNPPEIPEVSEPSPEEIPENESKSSSEEKCNYSEDENGQITLPDL